MNWEGVMTPKVCDGLGIQPARDSNAAMLGKLSWELIRESTKPWAKAFKQKYLKHGGIITYTSENGLFSLESYY